MWNISSANETLSAFCSSAFWDSNSTWNSPAPAFTKCFEKTTLVWLPCAFLWLVAPLEIFYLRRTNAFSIPFNAYNISKLATIAVLALTAVVDIAGYILTYDEHYPSVDIYSPAIKFASFCLLFALTLANIRCGVRSSGLLFTVVLLLVLCGAPQLRTEFNSRQHGADRGMTGVLSYVLYYLGVLVVFFLNCFADASPARVGVPLKMKFSPLDESSFLSKLFFGWVDELTWRGYRRGLTDDDVWSLDDKMRTACVAKSFESRWQLARKRLRKLKVASGYAFESEKLLKNGKIPGSTISYWTNGSEKASILRPLMEAFGFYSLIGIGFRFLDSAMGLANAQTLHLILASVDGAQENEYMWQGLFYVFRLIVICILEMLFLSYSCYILGRVGIQIRTALMSLVYEKVKPFDHLFESSTSMAHLRAIARMFSSALNYQAMKISSGARKDYAVGEIVNLMAVDAQRFVHLLTFYIPFLLTGSAEICIAMYCLWNILGICIVAGIVVFVLLMTVNALITPKIQRLQIRQMKLKDKRVKLTNEILSGIKVIKLYACEPSFEKQISQLREKEVQILRRIGYLQTWFSFSGMSIPFLISLAVFGTYVLMSEEHALTPKITFVSLSLFNIIKFPIYLLPEVVSGIVQCFVAVKRLDNFLNSEELDPDAVHHEQRDEPVIIENGEFSWDCYDGFPILRDINIKVKAGSLVAVVGSVGSGKSSLLSAILGEMYKKSGTVNTANRLAYVSQQAWIRNATLEDNVTFGRVKKAAFYDSVLEACAMLPDLKILPAGDQTELGEKGVNMSGGQKQRISLARAVYWDADTYLLDDPLSAVDSHVGKHIFEKVIGPNGLLREKTRILVTHNVAYLPQMDHIIVLRDGTISECGTYDELLKSGREFADFLATYVKDNDEDDDLEIQDQDSQGTEVPASSEAVKKKDEVKSHTLIEKEAMEAGNVKWKVFAYYLRAVGPLIVMVIIAANVLSQVFAVSSYYWLSVWSSDAENSKFKDKQLTYVGTYAMWGVGQAISVTTMAVALYIGTLKAAKYIHNDLLNSVLHWPVVIFDRIPSGRILNRFSSDIDVLDNVLPHEVLELLKDTATIIATLFIFIYNTPQVLCVLLPVAAAYCVFQRFYVATSKQLKRFEAVSKSPIYSHFSDTITGAQSLRAYGLQKKFIDAAEKKIDAHLKNSYAIFILERWLVSRLSLLGLVIVLSAATFAILSRNVLGPALLGLSITYTLQVNLYFAWWIRHVCEVETNAVAVERIKEYTTEVEREAAWSLPNEDKKVTKNWPTGGQVVFDDFQVRYHDDLEPVLKGISFKVDGGKKVGIVGRTGAGKSSLTLSLFRLIESSGGSILVDDVDISSIGLHTLRNRLTIIPQDPVLFSGTLRLNLDPAEKYSDESIWKALEVAHLKTYVSSLNAGLQYTIEESGTNFSLGQRQLICLARALLRKTKLLILDEATAAIDYETDDLIQAAIRKEFPDCTVLTIAHRLNTVLDYDKILVLDKGRIVEFDSPDALLKSKESSFYRMAVDAGLV